MDEKLLTISEASRLIGVCENTLRDWDDSGVFRATRTEGGHRRYSLGQVREYLEENPSKPKFRKETTFYKSGEKFAEILERWEKTPYLAEVEGKDKKALAVLLYNAHLYSEACPDNGFSQDELLWLTAAGWKRSKVWKMVSVQPMDMPCCLAYYSVFAANGFSVESEAVAATTIPYHFKIFVKAKFESIKEIYADAIAAELDQIMCEELLPKINVENLLKADLPFNLKKLFDYLMAPESILQSLKDQCDVSGVDLFEIGPVLDPDSFLLNAYGGRYPDKPLQLPIFCPYLLITPAPITSPGTLRGAMLRAGWFKGEKND
jgi:excisionase family DNA binding protein